MSPMLWEPFCLTSSRTAVSGGAGQHGSSPWRPLEASVDWWLLSWHNILILLSSSAVTRKGQDSLEMVD